MTLVDSESVATAIRRIVADGEIQGSRLAAQLRAAFPSWHPPTTLRRFIATNVPSVAPIRRSGMDYVYGLLRPGEPPPSLEPNVSRQSPWRAWVSPNGRFDLLVDPLTGSVEVLPRSAPGPVGSLRLTPPSAAEHRELALVFVGEQFVVQNDDASASTLLKALDVVDGRWWVEWEPILQRAGKLDSWRSFRRRSMLAWFRARLPKTLSEAVVEKAIAAVAGAPRAEPAGPSPSALAQLRALVIRVVENMDEAELKALQLPAGAVLSSQKKSF